METKVYSSKVYSILHYVVSIRNISFKRQIKDAGSTKYVISKYQNVELIEQFGMLRDMNPEGSGAKG